MSLLKKQKKEKPKIEETKAEISAFAFIPG
jgi:hypothetical protein